MLTFFKHLLILKKETLLKAQLDFKSWLLSFHDNIVWQKQSYEFLNLLIFGMEGYILYIVIFFIASGLYSLKFNSIRKPE